MLPDCALFVRPALLPRAVVPRPRRQSPARATRRTRRQSSWLAFAATCGFLAGMAMMAALMVLFGGGGRTVESVAAENAGIEVRPIVVDDAAGADPISPVPWVAAPGAGAVVNSLRQRRLALPVQGMTRDDLRDSFDDRRGASRRHEAIDILAPRHTPVLAVESGVIARLLTSAAGGITVYQFDPTTTVAYYYAHLERYASGLTEGALVARGQVLGYVGTSGNAPANTPHLHFAIFLLNDDKRWWQGTAIDPFSVLR